MFAWEPDDAARLADLREAHSKAQAAVDSTRSRIENIRGRLAEADGRVADHIRDTLAEAHRSLPDLEGKAAAAEGAADEFLTGIARIEWHLRSCGPRKAEKLISKFPPTAEQQEAHNVALEAEGSKPERLQFDPERFPAALIAACTTKVIITGDDGETIESAEIDADVVADMLNGEGWSVTDAARLFLACRLLTQAATGIDRDQVARLGNA